MTELETQVRAAVQALCDEAHPVDMGELALHRLTRRRARRRMAGVAGLVLAIAAGTALLRPTTPHAPPIDMNPPAPTAAATPWPTFRGLGTVPSAPRSERLAVVAYGDSSPIRLLNPQTGEYPAVAEVDARAFSPDLRYAVVSRTHDVPDESGSGSIGVTEYGVYDMVARRLLGRLPIEPWVNPLRGTIVENLAWSPDGASIALLVDRGVQDVGWVGEKLVLISAATGQASAVTIAPAAGLTPDSMIGWTVDSRGVVLTAGLAGHVIYDLSGRPVAARAWPGQRNVVATVPGLDQVVLAPIEAGMIVVLDLRTGEIVRSLPSGPLETVLQRTGWPTQGLWRDNELILAHLHEVLAVNATTGESRVLHNIPPAHGGIQIAPAAGAAVQSW